MIHKFVMRCMHLEVDIAECGVYKGGTAYLIAYTMENSGIMIFDDYGFYSYKDAAKCAVDEFFSDKLECPISLRTEQCIVIKL